MNSSLIRGWRVGDRLELIMPRTSHFDVFVDDYNWCNGWIKYNKNINNLYVTETKIISYFNENRVYSPREWTKSRRVFGSVT